MADRFTARRGHKHKAASLLADTLTAGDMLYVNASGDLAILPVGADNEILKIATNVPNWEAAGAGGATQLSELSDVNTSTPTNRNVLVADGVDFESRALVEADISDLGSYITSITQAAVETAFAAADPTTFNNYVFNTAQTIGPTQDNYVLTYDNTGGQISLEVSQESFTELSQDTTPVLGGTLGLGGFDINGIGNLDFAGNIEHEIGGASDIHHKMYHTTAGGMAWTVDQSTGVAEMWQTDSAGNLEDLIIQTTRNGPVAFFYNGTQVAFTENGAFGTNGVFLLVGQSSWGLTPGAGSGGIWLDSDDDTLYFRNDSGTDFNLAVSELVNDASPQLGGNLQTNGSDLEFNVAGDHALFADGNGTIFGTGFDFSISWNGTVGRANMAATNSIWQWEKGIHFRLLDSTDAQYINLHTTATTFDMTATSGIIETNINDIPRLKFSEFTANGGNDFVFGMNPGAASKRMTYYDYQNSRDGLTWDLDAQSWSFTGNIAVTGTVDGIDIATDVAANTAKVSNATHTGDVTGATALTIAAGAVDVAMMANGTDGELLTWDAAGAAATVAVGTSGHVLTSNGVGAAPTFQAAAGGTEGEIKYKTSDQTYTSDITLTDDSDLAGFTLDNDSWYRIEGFLNTVSSTTADFKAQLVFTQTPQDGEWAIVTITNGGSSIRGDTGTITEELNTLWADVDGSGNISGGFKSNATTGGTFKIQHAQRVSDAATTGLLAGSWMKVTKLG